MTRLKVLSQFGILCWGSLSLVYSLRLLISFDGQTGLSIRGSLQPCWMKWVQMGSGIRWMSHRKSFYKHANVPVNSYILTEIFFLSDVALLTDNPSHLKQLQGNITEYATARGETLLFSGLRAQKLHVPEFPWGFEDLSIPIQVCYKDVLDPDSPSVPVSEQPPQSYSLNCQTISLLRPPLESCFHPLLSVVSRVWKDFKSTSSQRRDTSWQKNPDIDIVIQITLHQQESACVSLRQLYTHPPLVKRQNTL